MRNRPSRLELFGLSPLADRAQLLALAERDAGVAGHVEMRIEPQDLEPLDWRRWLREADDPEVGRMIVHVNDYLSDVADFDDEDRAAENQGWPPVAEQE